MQLRFPFVEPEAPPPPPSTGAVRIERGGVVFTVHVVRVRRARRYVLRVRPDGALRVTVPRGGSRAEALRFAERHLIWAVRERARVLAADRTPPHWTPGTSVLLNGERVAITCDANGSGNGSRSIVRLGPIVARVTADAHDLRPALERAMRETARAELVPQLHALAERHGLAVPRVTIRNQRSRWGSCSPRGHIALNFRLVQMPPAVREYILVHELMHIRQPNHSRRFWRLVESVCSGFREAERWLKITGQELF